MDIRFFEPDDAEDLASLLEEMQAYYGVPCPPRTNILESLAHLPPGAEILVAVNERIVGMAAFGANFPGPGLRSGFFLKDLYVRSSERGRRVGSALVRRLAQLAVERGHSRIDWTAGKTNQRLLQFYAELGGEQKNDRLFFRLEGVKLKALADGS